VAITKALTVALHKLAEERFAGPVRVEVSGVDEISTSIAESVIDLSRLVLGSAPTPLFAKVIVPSAASETLSPLLPKSRYRI
jgi:hypothetical protein